MERIKIVVKDRRGDTIYTDETISPTSSVLELKKHLLRSCDKLSKSGECIQFLLEKRNIGPERVRLTIGEARGVPL